MRQVAQLAGVSPITVSRTLRFPDTVAEPTRVRVQDAIARLNYVPNLVAGALSSNRSRMIAAIVPNLSNSVFARTLQGMTDELQASGYQLIIGYSGYSPAEEEALVTTMLARRPEGIVLTGASHTAGTRQVLRRAGLPVAEMWTLPKKPLGVAVGFSNFEAARAMTLHVAGKGYGRIGYIGGLTDNNDRTAAREAGYRAALSELGLPFHRKYVRRAPFDFAKGGDALESLVAECPEIDAVFAAADILAIGALLRCTRKGWRVPDMLGVAGFDDTALSNQTTPALTTVKVPQYEIGRCVAARIVGELNGTAFDRAVVDLGYALIDRDSL